MKYKDWRDYMKDGVCRECKNLNFFKKGWKGLPTCDKTGYTIIDVDSKCKIESDKKQC